MNRSARAQAIPRPHPVSPRTLMAGVAALSVAGALLSTSPTLRHPSRPALESFAASGPRLEPLRLPRGLNLNPFENRLGRRSSQH